MYKICNFDIIRTYTAQNRLIGINLEDTSDAKYNHGYPNLTSENRCRITNITRFMGIFAIVI